MSTSNERPDLATRIVTSDDNKPKQPTSKEFEKKMEELRLRLQTEKASELERQKDILQKNYEAELQRILHQKEKELKEAKSETKRVKEGLTLQVRDAERRLAQTPPACKEGVSRKLVTEVVELKGVKRRLEEALGDVMDSDKKKASELRKLHDEHAAELGRFKREAESDIRKLFIFAMGVPSASVSPPAIALLTADTKLTSQQKTFERTKQRIPARTKVILVYNGNERELLKEYLNECLFP